MVYSSTRHRLGNSYFRPGSSSYSYSYVGLGVSYAISNTGKKYFHMLRAIFICFVRWDRSIHINKAVTWYCLSYRSCARYRCYRLMFPSSCLVKNVPYWYVFYQTKGWKQKPTTTATGTRTIRYRAAAVWMWMDRSHYTKHVKTFFRVLEMA